MFVPHTHKPGLELFPCLTNLVSEFRECLSRYWRPLHGRPETHALDLGLAQFRLAITKRWHGALTDNIGILTETRDGYTQCVALEFESEATFQ